MDIASMPVFAGLVFNAHRLVFHSNSRLKSNKEECSALLSEVDPSLMGRSLWRALSCFDSVRRIFGAVVVGGQIVYGVRNFRGRVRFRAKTKQHKTFLRTYT